MPTDTKKTALRRAGVVLFDYLPLNAYTVSLPTTLAHSQLVNLDLRSIAPIPNRWKLAGTAA